MSRAAERPIPPETRSWPVPLAPFPLLTYAETQIEALRRHVPRALGEWDVEAIHQARVATRRMKAVLDLMRPVISSKRRRPVAKVLRKLRRRLGPLRDADVMLEHLARLAASPKCGSAATWLAGVITRQRESLRQASGRDAPSADVLEQLDFWLPVRDEMARAGDAVASLLAESVHAQVDAFAQQARRLADPNSGKTGSPPQNPHDLRISGKALRYTLEMALAEGHAVPKRVMKAFKQMQELLGAWHDFVVLTDQAMKSSLDAQLGHHDAARQEQVLGLARFTNRKAGQHLDAFRRLWTAGGSDLAAAIRAAVAPEPDAADDGRSVSESGTGPGPRGSPAPAGPGAFPPASPSDAS